MAGEFKKTEKDIVFTGKYMEMYIPEDYFERGVAEEIGDHFKLLGVVNVRMFTDIDGKHPLKLRTLTIPTYIYTYPSGGYENRTIDLVGKGQEESYRVAKFYNGDVLCANKMPANKFAFRAFIEILMAGKLPGTLPYNSIIDIWNANFKLNDVDFDIPDVIKEIIITELYRSKKDISVKFSKVIGKNPNTSQYDYISVSPREVTALTSTYAGLTFEAFDDMLINGMNNTKYGRKELESPMNEVLQY